MTAVAEPLVSIEDLFVESLFDGFSLTSLPANHPLVVERRGKFYANHGLTEALHDTDAYRWFGLFKRGACHMVGAFHFRPDRAIEVTDFYPEPTRDGVKAGYVALKLLKVLVDRKIIPFWIGGIVACNGFGQRHVEKFFGIKPRSVVYVYGDA